MLKALLDDPEGMASNLIRKAGGDPKQALKAVDAALAKRPKVSGSGAGQPGATSELARVFDQAEKVAQKAGDKYVTVEQLLLGLALEKGTEAAQVTGRCRRHSAGPQHRDQRSAQGAHRRHRIRRAGL